MGYLVIQALILSTITLSATQRNLVKNTNANINPNAGSSVAPKLIKCYNDSKMLEADYRLPATMETLIALIRKIEDNTPYPNSRELAAQILQSFRQDGITKSNRGDMPSKYGIPYSPKEWNSYKNIVILKNVIPYGTELDTKMLTDLEQCSLHYFLSKSVNYKSRGDEQYVCNQLGKYRVRPKRSRISAAEQVEQFGTETESYSACPVELGVINSKWGAISTGNLLAGIASGLSNQRIPINGGTNYLDSRYAATIAGDLAEAALYQISLKRGQAVEVGAEGSWNSTLEPKWYFVRKNQFLQLTDAEIRGGLDGLYLALSMDNIKSKSVDVKISQILDLYYSPRGVFNSSLKACKRKDLETSFTTTPQLIDQTSYFETILDPIATLDSSVYPQEYKELAELAVKSFNKYIPGSLNDPICRGNNVNISRISSNLVVFVDMGYEYRRIQPILTYFLDNIDVNRYDSKYSIVNAKTAETLINSSDTILDYHQMFNESIRNRMQQGIDFGLTLETIESLCITKLKNKTNSGGSSSVYLIIAQSTPNDNQKNFASTKMDEMKKKFPDMRILVLGVGQKTDYKHYVINTNSDVFIMPDTTNSNSIGSEAALKTRIHEIVQRMKELPRIVINPACGTNFDSQDKTTINLPQFVEPSGANIYMVPPNYFFSYGDGAKLRVRGHGYGSVRVCTSHSINHVNQSQNCKSINNDEYSHDIKDYCSGTFSECDPVYIYVSGESSYFRCTDSECRFPDNMKFTITLEKVGCYSSANRLMSAYLILISVYFIQYFRLV